MPKPSVRHWLIQTLVLLLFLLSTRRASAIVITSSGSITYTTITYMFAPAPQLPGDVIAGVGQPQTDDQGNVAMWGDWQPQNVGNYTEAIWVGPVGNQKIAAEDGIAAPGTGPGVVFGTSSPTGSTQMGIFSESPSNGYIVFEANVQGTGVTSSNNLGLWSGTVGNVQLDGRLGSPAPGFSSATYAQIEQGQSVTSSGEVAFQGTVAGPGITQFVNDACLWAGKPGALQLVAETGTQAPGMPSGTTFYSATGADFTNPQINDAGTIAFSVGLSGPQVGRGPNDGIWIGKAGALQLVAAAGGAAPGTSGATFGSFHVQIGGSVDDTEPIMDNLGNLAFRGELFGGDTTTSNSIGIFGWSNNSLKLLVRAGAAAPGVANATFTALSNGLETFGQPALDNGRFAFQAGLTGTGINSNNEVGIWAGTFASFHLVAQAGSPAPGTPAGVLFGSPSNEDYFTDPEINALGEVAFTAYLSGPGINSSNLVGLWATDPTGKLDLIMQDGEQYNVGGTLKTISGMGLVNDLTQRGTNTDGINDAGELSVQVGFTDNTQALVLVQLPVPEPTSFALMAGGGLCIAVASLRRRSKRGFRIH